jgi:ketosteroid isomerase-like protein
MSSQDNKSIAREIYDSFNRREFKAASKLVDTNAELRIVPFGQTFRGPNGMIQMLENWYQGFSDGKCNVKNGFGSDEYVTVEFTGTGTNTGTLQSPEGDIMPTNKRVEVQFCDVYRIRNAKIVEFKSYFDNATMLKQLGVLPKLEHH